MNDLSRRVRPMGRALQCRRAAAMVEYALLAALIAVVAVGTLGTLGRNVNGRFTAVSTAL